MAARCYESVPFNPRASFAAEADRRGGPDRAREGTWFASLPEGLKRLFGYGETMTNGAWRESRIHPDDRDPVKTSLQRATIVNDGTLWSESSQTLPPGRPNRSPTMTRRAAVLLLGLSLALPGCAHFGIGGGSLPPGEALTTQERLEAIRRAEVWSPTDIPSLDLKAGPPAKGAFAFNEWVVCEYKEKKLTGKSAKFVCETAPGHELRVKYGLHNTEIFGEVLSSRLFWALGFGALRVNAVRVRCHGCPTDPWRSPEKAGEVAEFDPAIIKQWAPGRLMETRPDSGWEWPELELIGPEAGAQARAHRDALKLLAAFVQHTDSKADNQTLLCPEGEAVGKTGCRRPVLMVGDFGLTFGRANFLNNSSKSANFARWSRTPVWKDPGRCVAQMQKAFTGTFEHPHISEAGRAFLAGLLVQLSDAQLRDLFEVGRVERRPRDPDKGGPPASLDEWVAAFKHKRDEIVNNHCPQ